MAPREVACPFCAAALFQQSGDLFFCAACKALVGHASEIRAAAHLPLLPRADAETIALPVPRPRSGLNTCANCRAPWKRAVLSEGQAYLLCVTCNRFAFTRGAIATLKDTIVADEEVRQRPFESEARSQEADAPTVNSVQAGYRLRLTRRSETWVVMGSMLIAGLMGLSSFGAILMLPAEIFVHELGHAVPAWLSSRAALPLPCGFTFWMQDRSVFTGLSMAFLIGLFCYRSFQEGRKVALGVGIFLALLFLLFTFGLSWRTTEAIILFNGVAGELWISTFLIAAFFMRFPDNMRWDFFRIFLLALAVPSWVGAQRLWWRVRVGEQKMPFGSMWSSLTGDGGGDLNRLVAEHGFTADELRDDYLLVSGICAALLACVFAWRVGGDVYRRRADQMSSKSLQ